MQIKKGTLRPASGRTTMVCGAGQGASQLRADSHPCIYIDKGKLTFVLVYVDDILIVSNDRDAESRVKKGLARLFRVKDLGQAKYCLGIEIQRDGESIHLS